MHLLCRADHPADKRFSILAVTRPIPWSEDQFGDLPEACPCRASVRGVECPEPAGQLKMVVGDDPLPHEGANDGKLVLETVIVWQVETERSRPRQHGAVDDVQSEQRAVAIDQHVFAGRTANDAVGFSEFEAALVPASAR